MWQCLCLLLQVHSAQLVGHLPAARYRARSLSWEMPSKGALPPHRSLDNPSARLQDLQRVLAARLTSAHLRDAAEVPVAVLTPR